MSDIQSIIVDAFEHRAEITPRTVDTLVKSGLLHHSRETGEIILSRPPEQMSGRMIVEAVLGTETPETVGGEQAAQAVAGASAEMVAKGNEDRYDRPQKSDNQLSAATDQQAESQQH